MTSRRRKPRLTPRADSATGHPVHRWSNDEIAVTASVAATLIVASWAFGGVETFTRSLILACAALSFFLALFPFPDRRRASWSEVKTSRRLRALVRFPVFWFGLLLFGYVLLQWINPDFRYVAGEKAGRSIWWLTNEGLHPRRSWPTSIEAPISRGNPLSFLQRYGAGWLLVCAIWIGFRKRHAFGLLVLVLCVNFAAYGFVALLQEINDPEKVLWLRSWEGSDFSGAFFYRNHGGAFLYLGVACLLAFHLRLFADAAESGHCGTFLPRVTVFAFAAFTGAAAILSNSRAAWGGVVVVFAAFLLLFLWVWGAAWPGGKKRPLDWIIALVLPGAALGLAVFFVGADTLLERLEQTRRSLAAGPKLGYRATGNQLSRIMFESRPLFGFGADSYGHVISLFQRELKAILPGGFWPTTSGMSTIWVAAHNDFLQALVELGRVGATLLVLPLLFWFSVFLRFFRRFSPPALLLLLAAAVLFCHAYVDLVFQSATLVVFFAAVLAAIGRWLTLPKESSPD